jgi:hypothetical protein
MPRVTRSVAPAVLGLGGWGIDRGLAQPFAARLFGKTKNPRRRFESFDGGQQTGRGFESSGTPGRH